PGRLKVLSGPCAYQESHIEVPSDCHSRKDLSTHTRGDFKEVSGMHGGRNGSLTGTPFVCVGYFWRLFIVQAEAVPHPDAGIILPFGYIRLDEIIVDAGSNAKSAAVKIIQYT